MAGLQHWRWLETAGHTGIGRYVPLLTACGSGAAIKLLNDHNGVLLQAMCQVLVSRHAWHGMVPLQPTYTKCTCAATRWCAAFQGQWGHPNANDGRGGATRLTLIMLLLLLLFCCCRCCCCCCHCCCFSAAVAAATAAAAASTMKHILSALRVLRNAAPPACQHTFRPTRGSLA
jgi:hypothetical protein